MKTVSPDLLEALARSAPANSLERPAEHTNGRFDLQRWIDGYHLDVEGPTEWKGGNRWVFRVCPWNPDHRNGSAFIVQLQNGATAAGCKHKGCSSHDWHALRDLVEPGWRSESKRKPNLVHASGRNDGWEPVIPFSEFDLPSFPTQELPDWLRVFIEAEANATQTPVDLSAMLSLSVLAAACAKKIVIRLKQGHSEPLNIFTVTALPPGNRKSAVFADTTRPLQEYEASEARGAAREIARLESARKIMEAKLKRLEQQAAAAKPQDQGRYTLEVNQLAEEVAQTSPRSSPKYIVDDCTPERLSTLIGEQGGRIAVMSAEGDVFDLMSGRYSTGSGASNLGVYLKGHAGDDLRVDRVGRAPEFVKSPALTVGLAVQPDVIRGLIEKPGFRGRGLLGRFLYALPKSLLGHRQVSPPPVNAEVFAAYHGNVLSLLKLPFAAGPGGEPASHVLNLDLDAQESMRRFESWLEPQLAEFGDLGAMTDWAGKLVGAVGRIAAILHMASLAGDETPWEVPVAGETIEHAIGIGRYLIPHAKAALALMGADPAIEQAKLILWWIDHQNLTCFSKRDLHQGLKGTFKKVNELDKPLAAIVDHGFIRQREIPGPAGRGRTPSPLYDVNPFGFETVPPDL